MERSTSTLLDSWLAAPVRRPLVLRGARQVGKTWLVRDLAQRHGLQLVEVNFERDPAAKDWFTPSDPGAVLAELSVALNRSISPEGTLLFLDEIQAAGEVLAKLRWFAEEMPQLPVIAAGSLLEFALADHSFSMPVGRIGFLHIEPMSFQEFLLAHDRRELVERLGSWRPGRKLSEVVHAQGLQWFDRYAMVGGMPAVVAQDAAGDNATVIRDLQLDLAATYRADFGKYSRRTEPALLDTVLNTVARSIGTKFVYARVGEGVRAHQARRALEMLAAARVCHIVSHSAANGLPLCGESKDSMRKVILNDIGLFHALLRAPATEHFPRWDLLAPQVRGQMAEQLLGQQLRLLGPASGDGPLLHYWQREGGRPGEIDYLVQANSVVVPVEQKSGVAGTMKSLHQFMYDKHLDFAIRFDRNPPSEQDVAVRTTLGHPVQYRLRNLPVYLAGFGPPVFAT